MPEDRGNRADQPQDGEPRIGVYTCYCGGNISDVVDCERVAKQLAELPNVVVSRTDMSMCSDSGQAMVEGDIKEHGLNRVVVGACAPALHEATFRGAVARAGLNPYLYHHVGIREQDSWVHHEDPAGATDKAVRLMSAGVAKARWLRPLDPIRLSAEGHALVIGGGVAGLRAAWDIARRGLRVTLVEKTPFLGGHMAQLESVFPDGRSARQELHKLIEAVSTEPRITIHTMAEVVGLRGYVGDFQVQIRQHARGVTDENAEALMSACQQVAPDEFNYGLTSRKLIYRAYPDCFPPTPAVDWARCPGGSLELMLDGRSVVLQDEPETIEVRAGAIVVATGFTPYQPPPGEFGFGVHPQVVTLPQFIRMLALAGSGPLFEWNGSPVRSVALIHCVGSRQVDGLHQPGADGSVNDYCSRVCCTAALHAVEALKERFPQIDVFDLYQDIRTYGRGHEAYYIGAAESMVRFLRYDPERPPVVGAAEGAASPLVVRVEDLLTWGEEVDIPVDLVVLAVGMMPNPVQDLIDLLKISPGTDRFLLEVHPKLRPVETAVPGIVLAGTAQGPMNIQESVAAASASAAKVAGLLAQGSVELEPFVARVDPERCEGTGECIEVCAYEEAITLETAAANGHESRHAVVTAANCVGCGSCVSACPNHAIDVQGWEMVGYQAMIDALVAPLPSLEVEA
jgi:heterodisulfide reductase subunit A